LGISAQVSKKISIIKNEKMNEKEKESAYSVVHSHVD
jgi:hypothetical protein